MKSKTMNMFARLILLLLLTALVGFLFIGILQFIPESAYAVTTEFDKNYILDDLDGAEIGGKPFQMSDYTFKENGQVQLLSFIEYCYSFRRSAQEKYGLYLYIYNQPGIDIVSNSSQNKVQLAVSYDSEGKPINYEKFNLQYCSASVAEGYEGMFYKYKIVDHKSADGLFIYDRVNADNRRYDISGFELLTRGTANATEYKVGGTYTYTGYAKGCGADADAESSLECDVNSLETITLDTRSTYWRNDTYAEKGGIQTRDEVVSVYFSVDDEVVSEYGKLQKIHASWLELNSAPILVTDNEFFYNEMMKYAGVSIPTVDNTVPLKVFTNMNIMPGGNNYNSSSYSFSWNIELENRPDLGYSVISKRPVAQIPFVFKSNNFVDRENLNRYVYEYNKSFNRGTISTKTNPVSADLFVNSGVAKEVNIDSNEKFDLIDSEAEVYTMHGFDGWISSLFNPNKYPGYRNIKMIEEIPKGISFSEGIAKKYFIDSEAVSDFKQYCFTEELKQKTVFLFRYRISDYVTYPKAGYTINYKHTKDVGYMAEMGVDLDFDIIDLTFNKDGVFAVIPVVMSPIDIINPITPPIEGKDWFSALIAIIVAVIVLIVLAPVLPYILKAVVWVVTLPFRAIGGIVKTFKKDKRG